MSVKTENNTTPEEEPVGWDLFRLTAINMAKAKTKDPDAVALYTETGEAMSGEGLLEYSLGLDRALRAAGVVRGDRVMLVNEITAFAMAAALAVIRVGAVFIPNDPNDPAALRAEIIATAKVKAVLAEKGTHTVAPRAAVQRRRDCSALAASLRPTADESDLRTQRSRCQLECRLSRRWQRCRLALRTSLRPCGTARSCRQFSSRLAALASPRASSTPPRSGMSSWASSTARILARGSTSSP
jgi:acyl-CoA synthetase (AMP-forming)/AMP-acid ligase II